MKLKKYAKLVKKNSLMYICHVENSGIWLGSTTGFYRAGGLPPSIDAATMMTVLDFDRKAAEKIVAQEKYFESVRDMLGLDLSDDNAPDIGAKKIAVAAVYKGNFVTALLCDDGELIFYDEALLSPLDDVFKESEYVQTVVRVDSAGKQYVVVRDGLSTLAGIMPMQIVNKEFLGDLADFQARCTEQYFREESRKVAAMQAEDEAQLVPAL